MKTFKGKKIFIVGLSVEGMDSVRFFLQEEAIVTVSDRRTKEELGSSYSDREALPILWNLGESYLKDILSHDLIVRTPGISPHEPAFIEALNHGIPVTSQSQLFMELCKAPIIGVTGTKGKGTTSTLIKEIIEKSGKSVYIGGNVGDPILSIVRTIKKNSWVVLELSSFQLEDMTISPHIAVVLRISQDHLANFDKLASNYHIDRTAYVNAKKPIVLFQKENDFTIVTANDPTSTSFGKLTKGSVCTFDRYSAKADCYVENHTVFLKNNKKQIERICSSKDIQIRGDHNLENIAAATLACLAAKVPLEIIQEGVRSFKGLEHRLEFVRIHNGVSYFNDSFSTVPDTTEAAIDAFEEPKIIIAGGSEKLSDFTHMGEKIADSNVKAMFVIGQMTDRIVESLKKAGYKGIIQKGFSNMHEVVKNITEIATAGDVVILSPACASFGMFKNYKERGKLFKYEVSLLQ